MDATHARVRVLPLQRVRRPAHCLHRAQEHLQQVVQFLVTRVKLVPTALSCQKLLQQGQFRAQTHVRVSGICTYSVLGQVNGRQREGGRSKSLQLEVGQSQVQQKSREQLSRVISTVDRLQVNFDEAQCSGEVQVEFNNSENSGLHPANVIIVEGLRSHVGQLVQGDAANFLVLGGDEGRRDAE